MITGKPHPRRINLRAIADFSIAGVCGLVFAFVALFFCVEVLSGKTAGMHDFIAYWATGRQLVHHANPYDGIAMLRIERSAGLPDPVRCFLHAESAVRPVAIVPTWIRWPANSSGTVVASPADDSGGFGAHAVDYERPPQESPAPSLLFLWTGTGLPDCWTVFSLCAARVGAVFTIASQAAIPGRSVPSALCFEAALVSTVRCCARRVGNAVQELQNSGWRNRCDCRKLRSRILHRPDGVDAVLADDAHVRDRAGIHSVCERRVAPLDQPSCGMAPVPADCVGLRVGITLFLDAPRRLGLDGAR